MDPGWTKCFVLAVLFPSPKVDDEADTMTKFCLGIFWGLILCSDSYTPSPYTEYKYHIHYAGIYL